MNAEHILAAFRALPTGNISDALIELGITGRALHGLAPLALHQARYAGWAYTVQQRQKSNPDGPGRTRHAEVIDLLSSPGDVIVIDVDGRADVCSLGALLARRGKARGLAGFVVNGCVRDAAEIREVGFPVHCVGLSPQKSSVELETESVGMPIIIGDCRIEQGDLIIADDTGVMCVPRADVERVLGRANAIHVAEEKAADLIDAGSSLVDAFADR